MKTGTHDASGSIHPRRRPVLQQDVFPSLVREVCSWVECLEVKRSTSGVPYCMQRAANCLGRSCHSTDNALDRERALSHMFSAPERKMADV